MKTLLPGLLLLPTLAFAHRAGTKQSGPLKGCHNHTKSGTYHCHSKSIFNGKSWRNEALAIKFAIKNDGKSPSSTADKKKLKKYKRTAQFGSWIDKDGDCQNERAEILIKESKRKVSFTKRKDGRNCTVSGGLWDDFYYLKELRSATLAEIDHIVPVKHAFDLGAHSWSKRRRVEFYNDPLNLVITYRKYNREKGAKTPSEWLPIDRGYACRYLKRYFKVKKKYDLKILKKEQDVLKIVKCED